MYINEKNRELAVALRHQLHAHPELSMHESWTKTALMDFLRAHTHLEIVDRGRWFYAVHHGGGDRPAIAFRADMDAVPVDEDPNLVPYASQCPGAGHKCGHDGHSASLCAFALELERRGLDREVYLLFQHAEETGQGALECLSLLRENDIREIYAFHNLPGVPYGAVAVPDGVAQFASVGMIMRFTGRKSHACYPENGINPAYAVSEIVSTLPSLTAPGIYQGLAMITVIEVHVGEHAFGTSAGSGELLLTVRGEFEAELDHLTAALETLARTKAAEHGLTCAFDYEDRFPETRNHPEAAEKVRAAASRLNLPVTELKERFRASEDFGHYTKLIPGAMLYLGDGEGDVPPLHTARFDFPDPLIEEAAALFCEIAAL